MLVSALLLLTAPVAADQAARPVCQDHQPRRIAGPARVGAHKLGEEPPARQVYTVLRAENGCSRPVLVNDRVIGAPAGR